MHTLGQRASFWTAAGAAAIAFWSNAAPTEAYPLYATRWHLSTTVTTSIFAVFPIVLVLVLTVAGDISDHLGRRASLLLGLGSSAIGAVLFAVAPQVGWLFAGRAFMGVGVGLSLSAATAAAIEFSPPGKTKRANAIVAAAAAAGLIAALLVTGSLVEYAPDPLHLSSWVLAAAIGALFVATLFMPRHVAGGAGGRWRPKAALVIPRGLRVLFTASALAVSAALANAALLFSLGASIAKDLIRSDNTLVSGSVLALTSAIIGAVALSASALSARTDIVAGGVGMLVAMALLLLAAHRHSLPIFILAAIAAGAGYGLLLLGGLTLINTNAPAHQRGGTISGVYLFAYLMQGAVAVSLGIVATATNLQTALNYGTLFIALLSIAAIVALTAVRRAPAATSETVRAASALPQPSPASAVEENKHDRHPRIGRLRHRRPRRHRTW